MRTCDGRYLNSPVRNSTKQNAKMVTASQSAKGAGSKKFDDARRRIFSHGSSIENTNVDSNHILRLQKKCSILDFGRSSEESGMVTVVVSLNPFNWFNVRHASTPS